MIKNYIFKALVLSAVLILSGCGGGGGDTPSGTTTNTTTNNGTSNGGTTSGGTTTNGGNTSGDSGTVPIQTGSGFYVDAAIAGVTYSCGSQNGLTNNEGKFTFEVGKECRFSLDDILLRIVPAPELFDGVRIFEDLTFMAQVLQSLDSDGNASNGITISSDVVALLNGMLPTDEAELQALVSDLESAHISGTITYAGHFVDAAEAEAHLEATRQVLDSTPPVIVLNGSNPILVPLNTPFVDPGVMITDDYYNNLTASTDGLIDTSSIGTYTIVYTAVDGAGNSASVSRTVKVVDVSAPVITLTETEFTVEAGTVFDENNVSTGVSALDDVDGAVNVAVNMDDVQLRTVGDYNITYSAIDQAGNMSNKKALVHIVDTTAPAITLVGSSPVVMEVGAGVSYVDTGVMVVDNTDEQITASVSGSVNATQVNTYTVIYTAEDSSGNKSQISRTVQVLDTTPPTVTLNGASEMTITQGSSFVDPGINAGDNSGVVPSVVVTGGVNTAVVNTYIITYTATDEAGKSVSVERTVHVVLPPDTTAPAITIIGTNPITIERYSSYSDDGATALDDRDGSVAVIATGSVDDQNVGSYTITYSAKDSALNEATVTRTVNVEDTTAPVLFVNGSEDETISVGSDYIENGVQITGGHVSSNIEGDVNTSKIGDYIIKYTATDEYGNVGETQKTVHVIDDISPVITLNGSALLNLVAGETYVELSAQCTDNYDNSCDIQLSGDSVDTSTVGTYNIIYNASDASGNQADEVIRRVVVAEKDTTPDAFTFIDLIDVPIAMMQESNITVIGINADSAISIINGEYSIDDRNTWKSNEGNVSNGAVVYVRHMSSDDINTSVDTNVTIGGVSDVFTSVTDDFIDQKPYVNGYPTSAEIYAGQRLRYEVLLGDDIGVVYCKWEDEEGNTLSESSINPPEQNTGGGECDVDFTYPNAGIFNYKISVTDTLGQISINELNVTVLANDVPVVDIINESQDVVLGTTLELNATIIDDNLMVFRWDISTETDGYLLREDQPFFPLPYTFDRVGLHTIELVVWDEHGVQATDSIEINVVPDDVLPVITLIGDSSVELIQGGVYVELGATASDNMDGDITSSIVVDSSAVEINTVGSYSVVYAVTDSSNNSASITRTVHVILAPDTTPPIITLNGSASVELMQGDTYTEEGADALDDRDGVVTVSITGTVNINTPGVYTVTYTARDNALNEVIETRTVTVVAPDAIPVITLLGENPHHIDVGTTYSDAGVTVNDAEDGTLTASVDTSKLNMSVIGTQYVYYTATDSTHNVAEANRTVIVEDNTAPYLALNGSQVIYLYTGDTYSDEGAVCIDNYDTTCGVWIEASDVDTNTAGTYSVRYAGEDSSLNQAQHIVRTVIVRVELLTVDDEVSPSDIGPETVDVLKNDQYDGEVTVSFFLGFGPNGEIYDTSFTDANGSWTIVDNNVTFTPSMNFEGGTVSIQYAINNTVGKEATVTIHYAEQLIAKYDSFIFDDIVEVMVDPTSNDAIPSDSTVNMNLVSYHDQNGPVYASIANRTEGNWSVSGTQVVFSPSATFSGGYVSIEYHIYDQNGNESVSSVSLSFPAILYAEADFNSSVDIDEAVSIDLLANDTIDENAIITTRLKDYDEFYNPIWVNSVVIDSGVWSLVEGMVTFAPDATFAGGSVYMEYKISDEDGHESEAGININYPAYIYAGYYYVDAQEVESVTVDVLSSGTFVKEGSLVTVWFKSQDMDGNLILVPELDRGDGIWSIVDGNVTFSPNGIFTQSDAYIEYVLEDQEGRRSSSVIHITYPVTLAAMYDYVSAGDIVPINVNILANDTNTSSVTVKLQDYDDNYNLVWEDTVSVDNGNWTIVDGNVLFEPVPNFAGGDVYIQYQIEDTLGNTATAGITISYPIILQANYDNNVSDTIQTVVVPVTDNDVIVNGLSEVSLIAYTNDGIPQTINEITSSSGIWSIEGENISFVPASDFLGGSVYASYRIIDVDGKSADAGVSIHFPALPSPICTVTILNDIESVYSTIADNIDFTPKADSHGINGLKTFTTELDTDEYRVLTDVYTNATGNMALATSYELFVEDYVDDEVYLDSMTISLNDTTKEWTYTEEEIVNDNGKFKYSMEENGTYSINGTEVVLDAGVTLKYVREISANEMQTMLVNGSVNITLDASDTAQLMLMKMMEDQYDWEIDYSIPPPNPKGGNTIPITTLHEFVTSREYNASATGYINAVLYSDANNHGLVFAADSSANTGMLVEIDTSNNTVLNSDAGTWSIETISNDGETFDVLSLETTLCGYDNIYYRFDTNGNMLRGEKEEEAGEIKAKIVYGQSLYDRLKQYFIDNASVDISGPYPPSITEGMILNQTFYFEPMSNGDGTIGYDSIYFVSSDTIEYTSIVTDADGTNPVTNIQNIQYELDYGKIILLPLTYEQEFILISEEVTLWNMQNSKGTEQIWLFDKPVNYPN